MHYTTLISVDQLQQLRSSGADVMVFDCTSDLMRPELGEEQYLAEHIPGALHAHLDRVLSAKQDPTAASGGRHPLPSREKFASWLSGIGFSNATQAVVYDRNGCNYCGRLWWMLRWLGHDAVAVLDGGLQAWKAAGAPLAQGTETQHRPPSTFALGTALQTIVDAPQVLKNLGKPGQTIVDARGAPRYRGEVEPIDPAAGRIPGALNRPFSDNLGADGRFKSPAQLKAEFETLLAGRDPSGVVHHCGSGVSATPNVLAMQIAGLPSSTLYAGSWSDWCSDTSRPIAQG